MLICPECGNREFKGIKLDQPFQCPSAGCKAIIDPLHPVVIIREKIPEPSNDFWSNSDDNPNSR